MITVGCIVYGVKAFPILSVEDDGKKVGELSYEVINDVIMFTSEGVVKNKAIKKVIDMKISIMREFTDNNLHTMVDSIYTKLMYDLINELVVDEERRVWSFDTLITQGLYNRFIEKVITFIKEEKSMDEKIEYSELQWGRIINSEDVKIPTLEIVDPNLDDDDHRIVGYITPFRCYKFQVSATVKGACDMGSTAVIGLGHLLTMEKLSGLAFNSNYSKEGIAKELIRSMISLAVNNYCYSSYGQGYVPPRMEYSDVLNEYIDKCYDYIRNVAGVV